MQDIYLCKKTGIEFMKIPFKNKHFFMAKHPVTQNIFRKLNILNPSRSTGQNRPITNILFKQAKQFCVDFGMKLPSEKQWKIAAGEFPKENIDDYIWHTDNSNNYSRAVGRKKPNKFGLHDMFGNIWEFTSSWYDENKDRRVLLGGSFRYDPCSLENRLKDVPFYTFNDFGFRPIKQSF